MRAMLHRNPSRCCEHLSRRSLSASPVASVLGEYFRLSFRYEEIMMPNRLTGEIVGANAERPPAADRVSRCRSTRDLLLPSADPSKPAPEVSLHSTPLV